MALFAGKESKGCASWAVDVFRDLSYSWPAIRLPRLWSYGWNPPLRLKSTTTSSKEEPCHRRPHQIRRNKSSELNSTVIATSVTRVFMAALLLFPQCFDPYNNFRTMQRG